MNTKPIIIIVLFFIISLTTEAQKQFKGCATGTERIEAIDTNLEKDILRLVNIERKKRGLQPVIWNNELANAARYHAADMAHDNYFEHASHDRKGQRIVKVCGTFDRIKKFCTSIFACSENISAGSSTASSIVNGWMNSPGHRKNILFKSAKYMGAGYYKKSGSTWGSYAVQCFGY